MRLQFSQLDPKYPGVPVARQQQKSSKHARYTLTRAQLRVLEDLFQCFIQVEEDGSLRVVDGDSVSLITPEGAIARHSATPLGEDT